MDINKLQNALSRLTTASVVIGGLPESPGYNGSRLIIDDEEAENVIDDIDFAIDVIKTLLAEK